MAGTDALWTLALWGTAAGVWRADRRAPRLVTLAVLGAVTAIEVERVALADGRWTYNTLMPSVPMVGVGLWPVAPMTVLPVITVCLARGRTTRQLVGSPA